MHAAPDQYMDWWIGPDFFRLILSGKYTGPSDLQGRCLAFSKHWRPAMLQVLMENIIFMKISEFRVIATEPSQVREVP